MDTKRSITHHVDEHVVRLVAAQVVLVTLFSLIGQWVWPLLFLAVDFALRAYTDWPASLAVLARGMVRLFHWPPKPIFAAPKKFAAGLGFIFVLVTAILLYFQLFIGAYLIGALLLLCAFLESVFNVCVGCYVYSWLIAPLHNKNEN